MGKGFEPKDAMATSCSTSVNPTKGKFGIGNVDEHIVDTGPAGTGIFEYLPDVFAFLTKEV